MLKYLINAQLRPAEYVSANPGWLDDHEHCALCGAKFSERRGYLKHGLVTENGTWICMECYEEYRDQYQWTLRRE